MRPTIFQGALLLAILLAGCSARPGDGRESPGDRREWSILQTLELEIREQRAGNLQFREVDEYELISIPREADSRLIWVMLNPAHPPFYKKIPEGNFWLDYDQFQALVAQRTITSTVEEALRSHLKPR